MVTWRGLKDSAHSAGNPGVKIQLSAILHYVSRASAKFIPFLPVASL